MPFFFSVSLKNGRMEDYIGKSMDCQIAKAPGFVERVLQTP
jgi:hypothetical protein